MSEKTPYYPDQGAQVRADAVYSLLPAGAEVGKIKILFVHAHPDDESTSTGATMGFYRGAGAEVDLVTATRGEMGEVIQDELKYLEATHPENKDGGTRLGRYRTGELSQALKVLGVKKHIYLGEGVSALADAPKSYSDSGMIWGADGKATANPQAAADSFTRAPLEPQAQALAAAIRALRPDVLVTYDADGGYGHPDHVRVHEMTVAALRHVIGTEYEPKLVWGLEGDFDAEDGRLQAVIDGDLAAKRAAMAAHATQVTVTSETTFEYSNRVPQKISARETYRLLWSAEGVSADRQAQPGEQAKVGGAIRQESPSNAPVDEEVVPGRINTVITSLALGLLAGAAGTLYHAHIWYFGSGYLPWGALLAILTLTLACTWNNLRAHSSWAGVLTALTAFGLTFMFSALKGTSSLLVLINPAYPIGMAGTIWALGTLLSAVFSTMIYGVCKRSRIVR